MLLQVRHVDKFVERHEKEWPLKRTKWTKLFLEPGGFLAVDASGRRRKSSVTYKGLGDGVTFLTEPLKKDTEITGPIAAKLWVSSATEDADLFLVVRAFSPDMKELVFQGALDPHTPLAQGWLRASHRKLDKKLTLPYRPYHTHDEEQKLTKGEVVECDVEVWPTCIVVPAGYRLALSVRGKDYVYPGGAGGGPEDARHVHRRRPVQARRSARPARRGVRRRRHAARRAGAECLCDAADHSGEVIRPLTSHASS